MDMKLQKVATGQRKTIFWSKGGGEERLVKRRSNCYRMFVTRGYESLLLTGLKWLLH